MNIVEVKIEAKPEAGEFSPVDIFIGRPELRTESNESYWRCEVTLTGVFAIKTAAGKDSLQALTLALYYIREKLKHFVDSNGALRCFEDKRPFELRDYFP